jgi:small neutral amino acid transporter SnatA (MarC family)
VSATSRLFLEALSARTKGEATLLTLVPEMLLALIGRNLSGLAMGIAAEVLRHAGGVILTELAQSAWTGPSSAIPSPRGSRPRRNRAVSPGRARARPGPSAIQTHRPEASFRMRGAAATEKATRRFRASSS